MRLAISFPHGMVLQFPSGGAAAVAAPPPAAGVARRRPGLRPLAAKRRRPRRPPPSAHKQQPPQKGRLLPTSYAGCSEDVTGWPIFHLSAHRLEIGFQGFRVIRRETFI